MSTRFLTLLICCLFSACTSTRNLVYFRDLKDAPDFSEEIKNKVALKIQPDDVLSITVSSLSAESDALFNRSATSAGTDIGYLVDKNGAINFPVLGSVNLAGLTKEQATNKMTSEITKSIKNPIVNVRFMNFKVTVIGEVGHPSTFTIANDRINLIELLALAGDLTAYGKRENILIIREKDGVRSTTRVDLASKNILNSPSFYLQQNDVVYVEPAKSKGLQTTSASFYLATISGAVSLLSILALLLR